MQAGVKEHLTLSESVGPLIGDVFRRHSVEEEHLNSLPAGLGLLKLRT